MVIDRDDDAAFACDDLAGGAADAVRRRRDQRDLVLISHRFSLYWFRRAASAITSIASGWRERTVTALAPLSSQARNRSLIRARGPTRDFKSTHSSGTAAVASSLRCARYSS